MADELTAFYPDDSWYLFDSIIEGMDSLYIADTTDIETLAKTLAAYHLMTGRAAYRWHKESGLRRLDLPHIHLPRTERMLDAIQYAANCQHFGIYLFSGFRDELQWPMALNLLDYFDRSSRLVRKFMILAGTNLAIPGDMVKRFNHLRYETNSNCSASGDSPFYDGQ